MSAKAKDLTGKKFGRLTVIRRVENKGPHAAWLCVCECGNYVTVPGRYLREGTKKSCGCLRKEIMKKQKYGLRHGCVHTRLYKAWNNMIQRTSNPNKTEYEQYGGRGIKACQEWRDSFEEFRDWAMANGYRDDLTLDRIDVNGPYSPENCRWSDVYTQANNRSDNRFITYKGKTQTMAQWAREIGIKPKTLSARINGLGWDIERAIETPVKPRKYKGKDD